MKEFMLTKGIELIAAERSEQIVKHNHTIAEDSTYENELLDAAVAIIDNNDTRWPTQWQESIFNHILGKPYIEQLTIAGAFIAAEIDAELKRKEDDRINH